MTTIFSKIIAREIPAQFVYEDDICIVVMDKFPAVLGQTLVISKKEVDYILDLSDEDYSHLFMVAKKIAKASDKEFNAVRSCFVVEGFEVPHVHIKIYPMATIDENIGSVMTEQSEKSDEELQVMADKLKAAL
ncbi:MAG: histidine triad (HIT) family protein [Candidatus Paceibacteria bacterium]|jgi:histidine triad (HIT) family protein